MDHKNSNIQLNSQSNFLQNLLGIRDTLPKKQKQVCNYMIENHQSVGVLTIAELAMYSNVGTTTVMRFIKNLGYESYSDVKKEIIDDSIQSTPSAWWHLQQSFKPNNKQIHTMTEVGAEVINIIEQTLTPMLISNFDLAIKLILKSKRVHILGARSNKALAMYFGYILEEFYPNVFQLSRDTEFIYDRLLRFSEGDILILIDNAPFTTIGIETAKFCSENGHPVILITDHLSSPAATFASATLNSKASNKQYSIMPTLYIIESLIIEIGRKTSHTSISDLQKLSDILESKNITQPFSFDDQKN